MYIPNTWKENDTTMMVTAFSVLVIIYKVQRINCFDFSFGRQTSQTHWEDYVRFEERHLNHNEQATDSE